MQYRSREILWYLRQMHATSKADTKNLLIGVRKLSRKVPHFHTICCREGIGSRNHGLFSCCRVIKVSPLCQWDRSATSWLYCKINVMKASRNGFNALYRHKQWAKAKTSEAQLKMLLIATYTINLIGFMHETVANEHGAKAACLKQIKEKLMDSSYI